MLLWLQTTSPQFSRRSSLLILLLLRPCRNSQDGTRRSITWSCHWKTALKTCNAAFPRPFSEVADECCYELLGGGGDGVRWESRAPETANFQTLSMRVSPDPPYYDDMWHYTTKRIYSYDMQEVWFEGQNLSIVYLLKLNQSLKQVKASYW